MSFGTPSAPIVNFTSHVPCFFVRAIARSTSLGSMSFDLHRRFLAARIGPARAGPAELEDLLDWLGVEDLAVEDLRRPFGGLDRARDIGRHLRHGAVGA